MGNRGSIWPRHRLGGTRVTCLGISVVVCQDFGEIMVFSTGTALEQCTVYKALLRVLTQPNALWDTSGKLCLLKKGRLREVKWFVDYHTTRHDRPRFKTEMGVLSSSPCSPFFFFLFLYLLLTHAKGWVPCQLWLGFYGASRSTSYNQDLKRAWETRQIEPFLKKAALATNRN